MKHVNKPLGKQAVLQIFCCLALYKFRENIKYFCECNVDANVMFISATGKNRIDLKIYSLVFPFYVFNLKCSSFVTRKIKFTKFKEGLGYFLLSPSVKSFIFHSTFSCIWAILQEGTDQNKHLRKESDPHYCDPKSQVFSNGFLFQGCWLLLGFLCQFGVFLTNRNASPEHIKVLRNRTLMEFLDR